MHHPKIRNLKIIYQIQAINGRHANSPTIVNREIEEFYLEIFKLLLLFFKTRVAKGFPKSWIKKTGAYNSWEILSQERNHNLRKATIRFEICSYYVVMANWAVIPINQN